MASNWKTKVLAYLEVPYPITVIMMILPFLIGFLMAGGEISVSLFLFAFVLMFSYIGGFNTLNAISDLELDLISKPHRPIPSGRLSLLEAQGFSIFLFFIFYSFIFLFYQKDIMFLSAVMILTGVLYSFFLRIKKLFLIANIFLGLVYTVFPFLLGWRLFSLNNLPFLEIGVIFFFTTIVLICKDFEDYSADLKHNVKTFVNHYGFEKALSKINIVFLFFYLFIFCLSIFFIKFALIFLILPLNIYVLYWFNHNLTQKDAFKFFKMLTVLVMLLQLLVAYIYIW